MKNYQISIYGIVKKVIQARDEQSAIVKASHIWTNGDTRGISAVEVK